jgi:hypothetical protein
MRLEIEKKKKKDISLVLSVSNTVVGKNILFLNLETQRKREEKNRRLHHITNNNNNNNFIHLMDDVLLI